MRPITVKLGPFAAANGTKFRAAATIAGAGSLTLLTTVVDTSARRIAILSAANDSGITFTLSGRDWNGQPVSEVVTGASGAPGTSTSTYDYLTLTSAVASGASAGNVSIGTSATASSRPVFLDTFADPNVSIYVACTGSTQNYTVEYCGEDPNEIAQNVGYSSDASALTWQNLTWIVSGTSAIVTATTNQIANQQGGYRMVRLRTTNAGSSTTDFATAVFTQFSNAPL